MLYMIGIGLATEKDISLRALEIIKKCNFVYLESYTSKLQCSIKSLERLYNKRIILADRNLVENKSKEILERARNKNVAFLIIGDVFSATTHISLLMEARKRKIRTKIIHNASILTAVGETGLELYKFGKVTSIPFENKDIKTPIEVFKNNCKNELHTLFLLDLDPVKNRFMSVKDAIEYLIKNNINKNLKAIACIALGSENAVIKLDKLEKLKTFKINRFPQCLIIPARKLHFIEEEALELWR